MTRELTSFQVSSRLQYEQSVPKFLRKYQNEIAGRPNTPSDDGEEWAEGAVDEFGREIRRPSPVTRDDERPGDKEGGGQGDGLGRLSDEEDEEGGDDAPQIVVLKEGKHLSAFEAENERRIAKGLPPLSQENEGISTSTGNPSHSQKQKERIKQSLNFSSSSSANTNATKQPAPSASAAKNKAKRRLEALSADLALDDIPSVKEKGSVGGKTKKAKKEGKGKKEKKGLLSFE